MKTLPSAHEIAQRLVVTNVKHDVNVVLVLEITIESHDIFVMKRPMDLNLRCQLLTSLTPGQVLF